MLRSLNFSAAVGIVLSIFSSLAQTMETPISLEELLQLCEGQKLHHEKGSNDKFINQVKSIYEQAKISLKHHECWSEHKLPNKFSYELDIPYVSFNPINPNNVVLVHTHGGPHVTMTVNGYHAELGYYLSHGYEILCPNYRGSESNSSDYIKHRLPSLAVEDIYAIIRYSNNPVIILRGGSYGSCVNANLLKRIKQGYYRKNIAGVHLMGGIKYPCADEIPHDIPLLIAHGIKDQGCPVENAARFALQLLYRGHKQVETFFSKYGDHHLTVPTYIQEGMYEETRQNAQDEYLSYLRKSTAFIEELKSGKVTITDQEAQIQILEGILSNLEIQPLGEGNPIELIQKRRKILDFLYQLSSPLTIKFQNPTTPLNFRGPTMAHLKLLLGESYRPDVRENLVAFFLNHFSPVHWPEKSWKDESVGKRIFNDKLFMDQFVEMIYVEEEHLVNHSNSIVLYHAAHEHNMRLYIFMNIWHSLLRGESVDSLSTMRFFNQLLESYDTIDIFLASMRNQWQKSNKSDYFNYVKGFPQRAISAVPFLTSSRRNSACCSLLLYFDAHQFARSNDGPYKKLIREFFKVLGIHSQARVDRMLELFDLDYAEMCNDKTPQAVMQQIFVNAQEIDDTAYLCQIWGVEFNKTTRDLSKPSLLKSFCKDPEKVEAILADNKEAFTNPEKLEDWDNRWNDPNFKYADFLQLRLLLKPDAKRKVNSFYRYPEKAEYFINTLKTEIFWDFSEFLLKGKALPESLFPGCTAYPNQLRKEYGLATELGYSDYTLYKLDKSLKILPEEDHSIFSGIAQMKPNDVHEIKKGISESQAKLIRLKVLFNKNNGTYYFNEKRYLMASYDMDRGISLYDNPTTMNTSDYTMSMFCKFNGRSKTAHIKDRTYMSILAQAASDILAVDFAFFIDVISTFCAKGSGAKFCFKPDNYKYFESLCEDIARYYAFPYDTYLAEEACSIINKSPVPRDEVRKLRKDDLDQAVLVIICEAVQAVKNYEEKDALLGGARAFS